jgi:hypothetical protein
MLHLFLAVVLASNAPNAIFNPWLLRTIKVSAAPVYLPAWIPPLRGHPQLYVTADTVRGYTVIIDRAPGCYGADACSFMSVAATRTRRGDIEPDAQRIRLHDGTDAYYTPIRCGASCGPEIVQWHRGEYTYSITVKDADRDALLRAANSMVAPRR